MVLPLPRNPVRMVTGTMLVSSIAAPDEGQDYRRFTEPSCRSPKNPLNQGQTTLISAQ